MKWSMGNWENVHFILSELNDVYTLINSISIFEVLDICIYNTVYISAMGVVITNKV